MKKPFFLISLLIIILAGGVLALLWTRLPPELPWLYSLPWGEGELIPKIWFAGGLIFLALVNIIGIMMAIIFSKKDSVLARVIIGANLLVTLLYLVSFLKVIMMLI